MNFMNTANNINRIVQDLSGKFQSQAFIFDLDGTLIDNNAFHRLAWQEYLRKNDINITEEEYRHHFNGRTNRDVIEYIYREHLSEEKIQQYALEKEALYREIFRDLIRPIDGLIEFLEAAAAIKVKMAIATSGIQVNIDFMFDHVPIRKYFPVIVHSAHIKKGKPHPEIYLKAADLLQIEPCYCLVFEDAAVGITSAKSAGMPVVAITSTQTEQELAGAQLLIDNYTPQGFQRLNR